MRNSWPSLLIIVFAISLFAADWPMTGGNPQRNGWAGSERLVTKANVTSFKLLYKYRTDNQSRGLDSLTAPIINGNLITYRGFKEMLIFAGSSDKVYSIDADLNKLLWETRLPYTAKTPPRESATATCPNGLTAPVMMEGSSSSSLYFAAMAARTPAGPGIVRPRRRSPYFPPLAQSVYPLLPTTLTELNALYAVSSDGYLHILNSSTGQDLIPSVRFVPPNAKVTSLNLRNNILYATTAGNCDGYRNAVFAIDILSPEKTVYSFAAARGGFAGVAGTTLGNDGTVYVQMAYEPENQPGRYYDVVVALTPKNLKLKDYVILGDKPLKNVAAAGPGITPVVFSFPGHDLLIAGGLDGRLYLLDSRSLGGADHRSPLFASSAIANPSKNYDGDGFRGVFSTWFNVDSGVRYFYTPVYGGLRSSSGLKENSETAGNGSIVAFQLAGTNDKPVLQPLWSSRRVLSPAPPVIADGMVFVLATGAFSRVAKKNGTPYSISEREQLAQPATLYAFDAATGKELYSSGSTGAITPVSTGLAFANGRAYFTARDNAVYCFGIPAQHTQLFEQ